MGRASVLGEKKSEWAVDRMMKQHITRFRFLSCNLTFVEDFPIQDA